MSCCEKNYHEKNCHGKNCHEIHYRPLARVPITPTSTIGSKSVDHVTIPEASYVSSLGLGLSVDFSEQGIGVGAESKVDPRD